MKIAFVITSTGWGGLELNTLKLAKSLSGLGYQITLVTQEKSPLYIKGEGVFASTILLDKKRKHFDFSSAKSLSLSLKKEGISLLLAFDNKDLDLVSWTKRLFFKSLKVIYQQQMQIGINKKDLLHTFRFKAIDCWISPLQYLKDEVSARTHFPVERVSVIPLCVDVSKFIPSKYTKQQALQALQITPKAPLFGIIGRVARKKGQLFLVEALLKLKEKGIVIELLIFGSATVNDPECMDYYTDIRETVKQNKLEEVVHFVDFQEDVSLFYNAVDVFVLASYSETFGMVTVEAMLSHLPIIATKTGGTSEILDFGKLGLLYDYENHDEFCEQVIWLLNNKSEAENMAARAQKAASEKYNQELEVNEIENLIKKLNGGEKQKN